MAVKSKKSGNEPQDQHINEAICQMVKELYSEHSGEIRSTLEESEVNKLSISFNVELDCSESEPMVTTKIRFSSSVTDKRVSRLDDPQQIVMFKEKKDARKVSNFGKK